MSRIGFEIIPTKVAAEPGWRPGQHPNIYGYANDMQQAAQVCNEIFKYIKQDLSKGCYEDVRREVFSEYMTPQDVAERNPEFTRYSVPALAVFYNEQHEAECIYAPTWSEMDQTMTQPAFDAERGLDILQARIHAMDSKYRYPLPEGYKPPLMPMQQDGKPIIFEHYGNTKIDAEKTRDISTAYNLKPMGGLWACEQAADAAWKEFTESWRPTRHDQKIVFELAPEARILCIDAPETLAYLQQQYPMEWHAMTDGTVGPHSLGLPYIMIDWAQVAQDYDGIYYSHTELYKYFGPFDVNSYCIFNPDVVIEHPQECALHWPAPDAALISGDLRHAFKYDYFKEPEEQANIDDDVSYYTALQSTARAMLHQTDDPARMIYYQRLHDYAGASIEGIQSGGFVPLHDATCVQQLNDLADDIMEPFERSESR